MYKKFIVIVLVTVLFLFSACATGSTEVPTVTTDLPSDAKVLVAYFSWSGNTVRMAEYIAQQTGGDLFEIVPEVPYPTSYSETGDVALVERDNNARPTIKDLPESIEEYDVIMVGYPIWWHTAPMIIGTFLENYDLNGKSVFPFTQSASMDRTQFNNSMDFIRDNSDGATVYDGLFVRPDNNSAIDTYLRNNSLLH